MIQEVRDGIFLVQGEKEGRFPYSNSFLLRGGTRTILFDAGCGQSVLASLLEEVKVDLLVLSHTHVDHYSSINLLEGVPKVVPALFWETVRSLEAMSRRLIGEEEARQEWLGMVRNLYGDPSFVPDEVYREGQTFSTGKHEVVAISAPGHTKDHFVFFEERSRVIFTFDIDLSSFGPWYANEESDIGDFLSSIRRVRDLSPSGLLSSHREPVFEGWEEELDRYEEKIYERDRKVEEMVQAGMTLDEMVEESVIYGGFPHVPALLRYFEKRMLRLHLERLGLADEVLS